MRIDFKDINYLKVGNDKQKKVFKVIREHNILEFLKEYDPIVVGTIPINIDIDKSDVDVILFAKDFQKLSNLLNPSFSIYAKFQLKMIDKNCLTCNFEVENIPFELYATDLETEFQYGYLHMIKEYEIIQSKGETFANQIRELKMRGIKTEPAFCELLKINGNPYIELLKYEV